MNFEIIYQPTPYSCMACVVAMITGDPLHKVMTLLGHDGSEKHFRFLDCASYLNRCGFHLGGHFYDHWSPHRKKPALLIVASSHGEGNHTVLWTGETVLDPEPHNEGKGLMEYTIHEWWPITRYDD